MRAASDRLRLDRAAVLERRKIIVAVEDFAASLQPVAHETSLQLGDDRSGHFVMIVTPMLRRIGIASPKIGDPCTADERRPAVHDEQFSVRAVVVTPGVRPKTGMIFDDLRAGSFELLTIFDAHFARSLRIENQIYRHAGVRAFRQSLRKFFSDLVIPENVGLEVN